MASIHILGPGGYEALLSVLAGEATQPVGPDQVPRDVDRTTCERDDAAGLPGSTGQLTAQPQSAADVQGSWPVIDLAQVRAAALQSLQAGVQPGRLQRCKNALSILEQLH